MVQGGIKLCSFIAFLIVYFNTANAFFQSQDSVKLSGTYKTTRSVVERMKKKMNCQKGSASHRKEIAEIHGQLTSFSQESLLKDWEAFTNLMICSVSCDSIENANQTIPFEWLYCPEESIHINPLKDQLNLWTITPRLKFVSSKRKKEGFSKKLEDDVATSNQVSTGFDDTINSSMLTVVVKPVTTAYIKNSLYFGENIIDFHATVTENTCSNLFLVKDGKSPDILAYVESSVLLKCSVKLIVHDTTPPTFTFCPGDRIFYLAKGVSRMSFFYDRPLAKDNSNRRPKIIQTRGKLSGEKLSPGKHVFEFVAEDDEHNRSICEFTVRVFRYLDIADIWHADNPNALVRP